MGACQEFFGGDSRFCPCFFGLSDFILLTINDMIFVWTKFCPYEKWATFEKIAQKLLKLHKMCNQNHSFSFRIFTISSCLSFGVGMY